MFDIGFSELLLTALVGLLVLGPARLPQAAHALGLWLGRMRRSFSALQEALEREVQQSTLNDKMRDPYATFNDAPEQEDSTKVPYQASTNVTEKSGPPARN